FFERVDDAISDFLGVNKVARDYARARAKEVGIDYQTAVREIYGAVGFSVAEDVTALGDFRVANIAAHVVAATSALGIPELANGVLNSAVAQLGGASALQSLHSNPRSRVQLASKLSTTETLEAQVGSVIQE